jgi:LAO/AO transport system kinase
MRAPPATLAALRAGGKAALAATLTALETAPEDPGLLALLDEAFGAPRGLVLGLTGPPGVGKSTLVDALIGRLRARAQTVGIVAVDPSSRRSGGALLGDRTRITSDPDDPGIFLRSMAARDRLGGLAALSFPAVILMRALFDRVIVETVGVGQSEAEISDIADLVILCTQPGSGDALQFMKAGITELPDIVLVTKADLGALADRSRADLEGALDIAAAGPGERPPVLLVSSVSGEGIDAVLDRADERRPGAAELARRRAIQARRWIETGLIESFGRVGYSLLPPLAASPDRPFAEATTLAARLRARFEDSRETL